MQNLPETERGLPRHLFRMTWPMLFGVLSLMSYQLADSAFIGQLGVDPLATLGFTVPMQQLIIGVQVGLGIATTAVIARVLGRQQEQHARELGGVVVLGGALVIMLLCGLIWFSRHWLLARLGADPSLMPLAEAYWPVWLLSAWLGAMLYFGYSLCRAHGDTRWPGLIMVATSALNIVLDPLYIFHFDGGLPGAAWATVTAFSSGLLVVYGRLFKLRWFSFRRHEVRLSAAIREIGTTFGPATISQLMPPLSAMLATALVADFGAAAVGAWGIGTRMEFFSIVVVLALTMSMPPIIGRYLGAGQIGQIRALVGLAVRFVIAWQLLIAGLWWLLSTSLSQLLATDTDVVAILADYLQRVPLSYGGLGVCMLMVSSCNALGMPLRAMVTSFARLFVCYLPALWLGGYLADIPGLLTGAALGNLAAGASAWHLYRLGLRQMEADHRGRTAAAGTNGA
ncbi:MATE family efflux transporter [Marinobacteraceae bacterium S3BR75-40.1]